MTFKLGPKNGGVWGSLGSSTCGFLFFGHLSAQSPGLDERFIFHFDDKRHR